MTNSKSYVVGARRKGGLSTHLEQPEVNCRRERREFPDWIRHHCSGAGSAAAPYRCRTGCLSRRLPKSGAVIDLKAIAARAEPPREAPPSERHCFYRAHRRCPWDPHRPLTKPCPMS